MKVVVTYTAKEELSFFFQLNLFNNQGFKIIAKTKNTVSLTNGIIKAYLLLRRE